MWLIIYNLTINKVVKLVFFFEGKVVKLVNYATQFLCDKSSPLYLKNKSKKVLHTVNTLYG